MFRADHAILAEKFPSFPCHEPAAGTAVCSVFRPSLAKIFPAVRMDDLPRYEHRVLGSGKHGEISSTFAALPMGFPEPHFATSSASNNAGISGVHTGRGATALTRMLRC